MALSFVLTNAGRVALVNAARDGTGPVVITEAGVSATASVATADTAVLAGEIKRIDTISGSTVAAQRIHMTISDESDDVYSLRSIGVYLDDGTLFATYGQPEPILEKNTESLLLLSIDVTFVDVTAAQVSFGDANFSNPPATTDAVGVVELATSAETAAGVDAIRAVTPAGLLAAFATLLGAVWRPSNDGAGSGLDADLLDGSDASYFTNIIERLGFTPVNRAGDVVTGNLVVQGVVAGSTPNVSTTGGVRVRSNPITGTAYLQFVTHDEMAEIGYFGVSADSIIRWRGNQLWHGANDGAGSGLDADLLDGLDSGAFARRNLDVIFQDVRALRPDGTGVVFLGSGDHYIYWNNAAYVLQGGPLVINGSTAWTGGNDGAGSGLDADLLDGLDSGAFARRNLDVTFRDITADRGDGTGVAFLGSPDRYVYWNGSAYLLPGGPLVVNGSVVWTAGNDGAGSGLDADTLDGLDSSVFERVTAQSLSPTGGYQVFASGLKRCWGYVDVGGNASSTFSYPISFDSWVRPKTAQQVKPGVDGQNENFGISGEPGLSSVSLYNAENDTLRIWIEVEGV